MVAPSKWTVRALANSFGNRMGAWPIEYWMRFAGTFRSFGVGASPKPFPDESFHKSNGPCQLPDGKHWVGTNCTSTGTVQILE